jgi:hypothetical protein
MKPSRTITIVTSLLLAGCMIGSGVLLHFLDHARVGGSLEEVLYISSPKMLKRLSLGYDGLLADIYWTRAVQYFGSKHYQGSERFDLLAPLLEITTSLDPHLVVAYQFGASFLAPKPPHGAGMPDKAVRLVEYGIRNNPNEWRLYHELGFVHYMERKDYAKAADAFRRGSNLPGAHPFMKVLAAQTSQRAGEADTAWMLWSTTFQNTEDRSIKANAAAHLRALRVDRDVEALQRLAAEYQKTTGRFPAKFSDLAKAGMLRGVPLDPLGRPYKFMPDGRIEVEDPDDLPFISKGTPPGYEPPKKPKILPTD